VRYRAFIFDVDGTLAETEEAHRAAFNLSFEAFGLDWRWDVPLYAALLKTTGGKERMAAYQRDYRGGDVQLGFERIAELHRHKTARYAEILASGGLALRPGVRDLIERAASAGVRLAIATTTSRGNVDALTACCWGKTPEELFEVVTTGEEVETKKPAPDLFELALRRLDLPPADCVAFEDSGNGVLSALAAGLRTIAIPCRYTQDHDFTGAARVLPSLEDFPVC